MRYRSAQRYGILLLGLCCASVWAAENPIPRRTTPASVLAQSSVTPFIKGESLTYTAKLNELPAGDGEIRLRKEQREGREVYLVTAQGRTNELVDYLFRLRGTADGVFAASGFNPISFRFVYTEGDRPRELGVRYDPATKMLIGVTKKKAQTKERSEPATEVYDPLSALYFFRSRDLAPGSLHQVDVFTGKDRYQVAAHVVRKEDVLLMSGERPAIRLHLEGFRAGDGARKNRFPDETTLWVSPDAAHVPLKVESFLPFGPFVVELSER